MTQEEPWPTDLARTVGGELLRLREGRFSAQGLADAVSALGITYTRAQVVNLERGRRDTITVGEVMAFAEVLGVPPLLLVFPVGRQATTEVVPGRVLDTWAAARWFTGEDPADWREDGAEPVDRRRWQRRYLDQRRSARERVRAIQRQLDEATDDDERTVFARRVQRAEADVEEIDLTIARNRAALRKLGLDPGELTDNLSHIDQRTEAHP